MFLTRNFFFILCLVFVMSGQAQATVKSARKNLGPKEIERVEQYKAVVQGIDDKSVQEIVRELEKSPYPMLNLEIKEAMAHAYADIIKEEQVVSLKKKQWLYSKVALNMAYLQFGGDEESSQGSELNKLILQKLKGYLPVGITSHKGFRYSLE